jgi:hypothetical protein
MRQSTATALVTSGLLLLAAQPAWACGGHMSQNELILIAALGALFAGIPYMLLTAPLLIAMRKSLFDSVRGLIAGFFKAYVVGVLGLMTGGALGMLLQTLVRELVGKRVDEQVLVVIALTTPLLFEAAWISRRWSSRNA